jgi:aryl-phospho-beta-D-glucosidase BglC (GH1 family)
MKGVNLGGWFSQIDAIEAKDPITFPGMIAHIDHFLGPEDFQRVKGWGFDHVRLPIDWFNVFTPDLKPRADVMGRLERAIAGISRSGLDLILDLHRCPGHDFEHALHTEQSFFSTPSQRRDCLRVWAVLAERFGAIPGIILELLNEPVAPDADTWNIVKEELAREIRRFAPNSTLLVGSNQWNHVNEFECLTPIEDDNVIYSFHYYLPIVFTHQKAPWVPGQVFRQSFQYPGNYEFENEEGNLPLETGTWNKNRMCDTWQHVIRFREKHGARVACNEWGVYMGGPDRQSQMAWTRDCLELFAENQIGWTYWNYKNLDFGIISQGEQLFANHPPYSNPERTDYDLLTLLQSY